MNVDEAIIELQKLQLGGNGKLELLGKYDGMVQEIESFTIRHVEKHKDGNKDWVPKDTSVEDISRNYKVYRAVRIITGTIHNNS